jgi:hypothetical protein
MIEVGLPAAAPSLALSASTPTVQEIRSTTLRPAVAAATPFPPTPTLQPPTPFPPTRTLQPPTPFPPTRTPLLPPDYGLSASVQPTSAAPGQTVTITAQVTVPVSGMVVVDVEVHDGSDSQVFQQFFDDQPFAAGQTRVYSVSWPVPVGTPLGLYAVQVGVFDVAFETEFAYNSNAAQVAIVSTSTAVVLTPTSTVGACVPRPPVAVTAAPTGDGRLQATILSRTRPGSPTNGLESIVFGAIRNGTVLLNGVPISPGTTVPLGGVTTITLVVARQTAGQATHVPFTVRDHCGDWPSFVGGGPTAF